MAVKPELIERVRQGIKNRERMSKQDNIRGLSRVTIEPVEHLSYKATAAEEPEFTLVIDEPEDRGGTNQGPGPLTHFFTGVGSCLLTQFVRLSVARDVDIRFKQMRIRAERERHVGGGFQHILQEIDAEGGAPDAEVESLTREAEAFCYVHATLSKAVEMTTVVKMDGREAVRRVSTPRR